MAKKNRTNFKLIFTLVGIGAVIVLAYFLSRRTLTPEPIGINEISEGGTVSLYASPTTVLIRPGAEKTMAVSYVSDSDPITAVKLGLTYSPSALTLTNFTNSSDFPVVLQSPTDDNGYIEAVFGVSPESGGRSGGGPAALFTIRALQSGTTLISFSQSTVASTVGADSNALGAVYNSTITVLYPGDINGDNQVDIYDYTKFVTAYNNPQMYDRYLSDFNLDGAINIYDYTRFVANFGNVYP